MHQMMNYARSLGSGVETAEMYYANMLNECNRVQPAVSTYYDKEPPTGSVKETCSFSGGLKAAP